MDDFPSNSTKNAAPEMHSIDKMIEHGVKSRERKPKTGILAKLIAVDDIYELKRYIMEDVVAPRIQNFIMDSVMDTMSMIFFKEKRNYSSNKRVDSPSYAKY